MLWPRDLVGAKYDTSSSCTSQCEVFISLMNSGDSYSSTGYDVDGDHPNHENPLGNPPYPGDTYSGGPTWVTGLLFTLNIQGRLFDYRVQ